MYHQQPNLINYIVDMNRIDQAVGNPLIPGLLTNLEDKHINKIKERLESDLSPENLHCDGEISYEEAMDKKDFYMAVHKELEEITGQFIKLEY